MSNSSLMRHPEVAPYAGAWIEIPQQGRVALLPPVAPNAGAWIETLSAAPCACLARSSLSDFCRLHVQWASWRLSISLGCPPLAMGMMWSIHGESGCGYFSVKSTGRPQMPHTVCVAYIFFLFLSNAMRCVPSWSGRFLFFDMGFTCLAPGTSIRKARAGQAWASCIFLQLTVYHRRNVNFYQVAEISI